MEAARCGQHEAGGPVCRPQLRCCPACAVTLSGPAQRGPSLCVQRMQSPSWPTPAPTGIREYLASDKRHVHVFGDDWRIAQGLMQAPGA